MTKPKAGSKHTIFFDFDNTITTHDVLDDILARFAADDRWVDLEKRWKEGKIGSRECLQGQMESIRVTKKALDDYLAKIKIDPYFPKLLGFFDSRGFKTLIISDNFDYILKGILHKHNIRNMEVYSNSVKVVDDRLVPSFPLTNSECGDCAHCKKSTLKDKLEDGALSVYIGDGLSDVCASKEADIVFAKSYLMEYFSANKLPHIPFKGLIDVYDYFKRSAI
jgi:2,3-diketo-5-methylthio-1-phosphopentane phosphatase